MHDHPHPTQPLPLSLVILSILLLAGLGILGRLVVPQVQAQVDPSQETVDARVIEVVEEGTLNQGGVQQPYQKLRLEILSGQRAGRAVTVDYGTQSFGSSVVLYRPDDHVQVMHVARADGDLFLITEPNRWGPLLTLLLSFVVVTLIVSRWKGVRSLLGLGVSLFVITQFILPLILAGYPPTLVSILGAFALLSITQYLIYGWSLKTHAAVLGILISLIITGVLAAIFVEATRLTGYGSEEVGFLQVSGVPIDPRGLLLAGILIGALGVLDDVTISQASSVFELSAANPTFGVRELYRRAMNIGRDHIASTVNTLVLAYVGASLPLLLLFAIYPQPFGQIINREFVTEEVVRTLVGSLGLITAVPITTLLAGVLTDRKWSA
ncbi:MAG TPA: YibE/F family protein [Anaerolineae bacterium]|nr:YibE/F family protein [Anaerolineae bacterium]